MAGGAVGLKSQHLGAGFAEFVGDAGEVLGLRRAARSVVFRVEINDHRLASEGCQFDRLSVPIGQRSRQPGGLTLTG